MKLGFVSAILPDLPLAEVFHVAASMGYECVELMCWPAGKAERRYAGVTHIEVDTLDQETVERIHALSGESGVAISGLGYYPNPLTPDLEEAGRAVEHIRHVIVAAKTLGIHQMNTFVGRDWTKSVDDNWPRFLETWRPWRNSRKITACGLASKTARCTSRPMSGRAARTWRSARPSGGECFTTYRMRRSD